VRGEPGDQTHQKSRTADQPDTSIVLHPPAVEPGITDDERRTIIEMMAKGIYASINLATKDLDGTFERVQAGDAEVVQEPTEQCSRPWPRACAVGSARVSRLLAFGDLHCDRRQLRGLVERAAQERCDALVSLGDLCYLPRDPEGRRFLRFAGALLRQAGLELLLVDGNHDDAEALARARTRSPAPGPVPLGFRLHHLPAGIRFRLGRLRCLAYGGAFPVRPRGGGRDWHRAAARERAALQRLAGGGEIDVLFCHDPRTLEQGAQARGAFAGLAAKLRPALVVYAHQHRPHVSADRPPALLGLGSFKDGQASAVVLDSAETGQLVGTLRDQQTGST
jgi:predicted phosphodiesterase